MKKIYLNKDFECSVIQNADTVLSVETDVFNEKCNTYIEGMRYVPEGHTFVEILKWYSEGFWTADMVNNAVLKNKISQKQADEIIGGKK